MTTEEETTKNKSPSNFGMGIIAGIFLVWAIISTVGWLISRKDLPPPVVKTKIIHDIIYRPAGWQHTVEGEDKPRDGKIIDPKSDTTFEVDDSIREQSRISFVHLDFENFAAGWVDSMGNYHYGEWDWPRTQYGLHFHLENDKPIFTFYDWRPANTYQRKWRIETEAGVELSLNTYPNQDTSPRALLFHATGRARLVLGNYPPCSPPPVKFEFIPIEIAVSSQNPHMKGSVFLRAIF